MKNKVSVLFVCLGNICRSPLAEEVFRSYVASMGDGDYFVIDSAGTSGYHDGEMPDDRMIRHAKKRGYTLTSRSRRVTFNDFDNFDYIIAMDDSNVSNLKNMATTIEEVRKIRKMTSFCDDIDTDYIPDPYFGGSEGFDYVIDLVEKIVPYLYRYIKENRVVDNE